MKKSTHRPRNEALQQRQRFARQLEPFQRAVAKMEAAVALIQLEKSGPTLVDEATKRLSQLLMSPEERFIQRYEQEEAQYWESIAVAMRRGDLRPFDECLTEYGPNALAQPAIQEVLFELWDKIWDDEQARDTLKKICPPLTRFDHGR
jgi:hypothetical protein